MSQLKIPSGSPSAPVSYIPVMAAPVPRKASKGSFGIASFSLLPSPRPMQRLGSPLQPVQVRQNSVSPSPAPSVPKGDIGQSPHAPSAIPKFKTLRNMLPFGPKQTSPAVLTSSTSPSSYSPVRPAGLTHRRSISSIPTMQSPPKASFLTFGPRKSFTVSVDRKVSAPPSMSRARSEDRGDSPVITISGPTSSNRPSLDSTRLFIQEEDTCAPSSSRDDQSTSTSRTPEISALPLTEVGDFSLEAEHSTARSGDLSTIMEAELSSMSMSKHLPPLVDINKEALKPLDINLEYSKSSASETADDGYEDDIRLTQSMKGSHEGTRFMPRSGTNVTKSTFALHPKSDRVEDLSTQWDASLAEFRRSMAELENEEKPTAEGSGSGSSASPVSASNILDTPLDDFAGVDEGQIVHSLKPQFSFNLSSLDPDLAELLSPHNISEGKSAIVQAAIDAVTGPPPMSASPSPSPEPSPGHRNWNHDSNASVRRISLESTKSRSFVPTIGPQSSPKKSRPSSMTVSATSSTSRIATFTESRRSSSDLVRVHGTVSSLAEDEIRNDEVSPRAKPRPFLGRSSSAFTSTSSGTRKYGDVRARALNSQLSTPDGSSGGIRVPKPRVSSDSRPSPSSRKGSSEIEEDVLGVSSSNLERSQAAGMSFKTASRRSHMKASVSERPESALGSVHRPYRTRRRSMSVTDSNSPSLLRKPLDWMGPRTVRAFTAAGLLDADKSKEGPTHSPPIYHGDSRAPSSRFRSSLDQGTRARAGTTSSRNIPSRSGFSDVSRSDSWDRYRCASRAGTMSLSELTTGVGRGDSPLTVTTSSLTPTTTRGLSASSATSLSIGQHISHSDDARTSATLQSLKDKHALETEALLNALVDSQKSTRDLKEENNQLHSRIRDLEEQIRDLVERLEISRRSNHLSQKAFLGSASSLSARSRSSSSEATQRRQHSLLHSFVLPSDNDNTLTHLMDDTTEMDGPTVRLSPAMIQSERALGKRSSTSSSVFPILPNNMSLLLHENDATDGSIAGMYSHSHPLSPSLSSPTLQQSQAPSFVKGHFSKPSVASIESIFSSDGDTTQFSSSGSPRSLRLKPEHEKHLGDMMSLDFSMVDSDG